jgi:hypothetical protein
MVTKTQVELPRPPPTGVEGLPFEETTPFQQFENMTNPENTSFPEGCYR